MKHVIAFLLCLSFFASCERPECRNTNPVFDKFPPESNEYKAELIRQLNRPDLVKLTYWIDKYVKDSTKEYMYISVQAKDICAKGILDITNAEDLEAFKRVKGMSYQGSELSGLVYTIDSTGGAYNFVFKDVVWIAD